MPAIPQAAIGQFNYVSTPASADPLVRYQIERAMADVRAADRKTRQLLLIEATAKQLAHQIVTYEEILQDEQQQHQHQHHDQQQHEQTMHDPNHHPQQQVIMEEEPQEQ